MQTGVPSVPEARERILALQTSASDLVPLLEDVRGRAFRRDERLREMNVELVVRRYRNTPAVQIIRVIEVTKDGRYEIDYWCEVCSIAMFEKISAGQTALDPNVDIVVELIGGYGVAKELVLKEKNQELDLRLLDEAGTPASGCRFAPRCWLRERSSGEPHVLCGLRVNNRHSR